MTKRAPDDRGPLSVCDARTLPDEKVVGAQGGHIRRIDGDDRVLR